MSSKMNAISESSDKIKKKKFFFSEFHTKM